MAERSYRRPPPGPPGAVVTRPARRRDKSAPSLGWLVLGAAGLAVLLIAVDTSVSGREAATRYQYDGEPRLIRRTTPNGRAIRYRYSQAGLLTQISYHRIGGVTGVVYPASSRVRLEHDAAGSRIAMHDASGTSRYRYDHAGRLSTVTNADGRTVAYEYDAWDRVRALTLPSGARIEYTYDIFDNVTQVRSPAGTVQYRYAPERVIRTLPNGIESEFEHLGGRLRSLTHRRSNGSLVAAYRVEYALDERIALLEERTPDGTLSTRYEYDNGGRLGRVTRSDGFEAGYRYDAAGNRTQASGSRGATQYAYDELGRLQRAGEASFSYDAAGNLVAVRGAGRETTYSYDDEDNLIEVRTSGRTIAYGYDGDGRRVWRSVDGRTTRYVHDPVAGMSQVVAEYGDGGAAEYLFGASRLARLDANGAVTYYLEGHLGSTHATVDGQGTVLDRYRYSPFGEPSGAAHPVPTGFLYTGAHWDADAGLLHLGARYYDPAVGRFLSRDPVRGDPGDPQTFNAYSYSRNDPINLVDPTGLRAQWWQPPPPPPVSDDPLRRIRTVTRVPTQRTAPAPPTFRDFVNHLSRGELFGTGLSETAVRFYADRYVATGNVLYAVPGVLFSAWTPETWRATALTLAGPGLARAGARLGTSVLVRSLGRPTPHEPFHLPLLGKLMHYGVDTRRGPHIGLFDLGRGSLVHVRATHVNVGGARGFDVPLAVATGAAWAGWQRVAALATDWRAYLEAERSSRSAADVLSEDQRQAPFLPPPPPPPPGGGGAAAPSVGGVYLDQAARILGELGIITGAMFDEDTGALVLAGERHTALPPMKPGYLAAALRAVFSDSPDEPGMTIDPHPQDPHGPLMVVRFFGNTANTSIGWVMFEADRLMKGYSVGVDNVTKQPMAASVPGYRSLTAMGLAEPHDSGLWSRFWLVPDPVVGHVERGGHAVIFEPVTMRVKTETMRWDGGKLVSAGGIKDRHAEQFAAHFTARYRDFARERPVYAELEQVAQAVALAMWMKERRIPVPWNLVRAFEREPTPTPETTPAARARQERSSPGGTLTIETFGGVGPPTLDLRSNARGAHFANTVAKAFAAARRDDRWSFQVASGGRQYEAAIVPPPGHRETRGFDLIEADFPALAHEFQAFPGARRRYSSLHNSPSELGFTWTWALPQLEFEAGAGAREYVSVEGEPSTRVRVQRFALTDALGLVEARFEKHFVDQQRRRIAFAPRGDGAPVRALYPEEGLYRVLYANGDQALFDLAGRLRALFAGAHTAVYQRDADGRLTAVRFEGPAASHTLTIDYHGERVAAMTLDGRPVRYAYDERGNLTSVRSAERDVSYAYDEKRLLVRVTERAGPVVENRYDAFGRLVSQARDGVPVALPLVPAVTSLAKSGVRRQYDSLQRLASVEDDFGYSERRAYDAGGNLSRIDVSLPTGGRAAVSIASDSPRIVIDDPRGVKTELRYDAGGRLIHVAAGGQAVGQYSYDPAGRLTQIVHGAGGADRFLYTPDGQIAGWQRTSDGSTETVTFLHDQDGSVTGMSHPAVGEQRWTSGPLQMTFTASRNVVSYRYDERGRPRSATSADGTSVTYAYAPDDTLHAVEVTRGGRTAGWRYVDTTTIVSRSFANAQRRVRLGPDRMLASVEEPDGAITAYTYDESKRLTRVRLPNGVCVDYAYQADSTLLTEERLRPCPR